MDFLSDDELATITGRQRPACYNRPPFKREIEVQDGWRDVDVLTPNGTETITVPRFRVVPAPWDYKCQQHGPGGAVVMYGWNCEGCKHDPR